jgi:phenylalanyl-tRNA synthetase beta chain
MNISYNWLRELTGTALEARELAQLLTGIGLAVEVVHEAGDDFVLEIDLTSNRPDCLSHLGVAREVAAAGNARVTLPDARPTNVEGQAASFTAVEIRDADLCPRYAARVVRGVTIKPSPDWLVKRLEAIGQRPINNVADITNYVLHEQGQPLHAFDLAKLTEKRIVVRRAAVGEKIKTLDGVERELDAEMLVIADAVQPVALAGVMGGEDSEISSETRDVLIESAYFNPVSVRRTSKTLGLHTEASHRFERGVDYEGVIRAQERCVALICELAGGTATEDAIDVYPKRIEPPFVSLRPERVKALTGLEVGAGEMVRILLALGFMQRDAMASLGGIEKRPVVMKNAD